MDYYTVDRIEQGLAVLESADKSHKTVPLTNFDSPVREGDIVVEQDGRYRTDTDQTEQRRAYMKTLTKDLFGK